MQDGPPKQWTTAMLVGQATKPIPCLVPRPHYCTRPMPLGSRDLSKVLSVGYFTEMHWPRRIGRRKTRIRQANPFDFYLLSFHSSESWVVLKWRSGACARVESKSFKSLYMNYVIQGTFITWQVKTFTCQVIKATLKSVITTQIPWLKLNPSGVYVVVIFFYLR